MDKMEAFKTAHKAMGDRVMVNAMEELAELIQAISKGLRGKLDKNNLAEELADVSIIIDWIKIYFGIDQQEVNKWVDYKLNRIFKREKSGKLS